MAIFYINNIGLNYEVTLEMKLPNWINILASRNGTRIITLN